MDGTSNAEVPPEGEEGKPEDLHIQISPDLRRGFWNAFAWISPTQRAWIGYYSSKERAKNACAAWVAARWQTD